MLGTPNGGSWAPMQVLSGDDTFGNLLINVGAPFGGNACAPAHRQFPGNSSAPGGPAERSGHREDLEGSRRSRSRRGAQAQPVAQSCRCSSLNWSGEFLAQSVLDEAVELRRALDRQRDTDLAVFADKLLLVVGKAESTPAGYEEIRRRRGLSGRAGRG